MGRVPDIDRLLRLKREALKGQANWRWIRLMDLEIIGANQQLKEILALGDLETSEGADARLAGDDPQRESLRQELF